MNNVITIGFAIKELTEDNFVSGLYVLDSNKYIYLTVKQLGQKFLIRLQEGNFYYYYDIKDRSPLYILKDDSLIKIQVKVNN
jgi:hypothetical protein